jgi:hypothetical protein
MRRARVVMHEDVTSVAAEGENPVRLPSRNQAGVEPPMIRAALYVALRIKAELPGN